MRSAFVPGAAAAATVATRNAITDKTSVMHLIFAGLGGDRRPQGLSSDRGGGRREEGEGRVSSGRGEDKGMRMECGRDGAGDGWEVGEGEYMRAVRGIFDEGRA